MRFKFKLNQILTLRKKKHPSKTFYEAQKKANNYNVKTCHLPHKTKNMYSILLKRALPTKSELVCKIVTKFKKATGTAGVQKSREKGIFSILNNKGKEFFKQTFFFSLFHIWSISLNVIHYFIISHPHHNPPPSLGSKTFYCRKNMMHIQEIHLLLQNFKCPEDIFTLTRPLI